jgi:hypothetical protein
MPPQINRLLLLTLVIVLGYFSARAALRPKSFGQYGWYRGTALRELADKPTTYAGKVACVSCHDDLLAVMKSSKHQGLSCEACHGPQGQHAQDISISPPKIEPPQFCLRCHQKNPARPTAFPQIDKAEHYGDHHCTECHQPHSPTEAPKA